MPNAIKKMIVSIADRVMPKNRPVKILTGPLAGIRWFYASGVPAYYFGTFERKKIEKYFLLSLKEAKVVFDLGANVGYYSLLASRVMGIDGKIFAFEPSKRNLDYLNKHLVLNHASNVTIVPAAVADSTRSMRLKEGGYGGTDSVVEEGGGYEVAAWSLDEFCNQQGIWPDVLKIDVEGAEMQVLKGAQQLLAEKKPKILLSTHSADLEKLCLELLKSRGYKITSIEANEFFAE
jgi:FkbM family methyltransferase